jgi:DNA-binding HxlR family transcriptional regulator
MMIAEIGPCILSFQYAPFGKYQLKERIEMKKGAFTCGLDAALFVLGGKWKPLILFHLAHGTRRYGELRRAIGRVSDKVLIQQLKELQADGIVDRADFGEIPRRSNIPSRLSGEPWERRWRLFASGEPGIRAVLKRSWHAAKLASIDTQHRSDG